MVTPSSLSPTDTFVSRHIGPSQAEIEQMLQTLGFSDLDALVDATIPDDIHIQGGLQVGPPRGEAELLAELREQPAATAGSISESKRPLQRAA